MTRPTQAPGLPPGYTGPKIVPNCTSSVRSPEVEYNWGGESWHPTGRIELRRRWFGAMRVAVEERRRVFRPIAAGWTPANWTVVFRWRWAR